MSRGGTRDLTILFITGGTPWPVYAGVNQRTHLLLRALRRCGTVDTVINSRYATVSDEDAERLREQYGVIARLVPHDPGADGPWRLIRRVSPEWASRAARHIGGPGLEYRPQEHLRCWLAERLQENPYDLIVGRYLRTLASSGALAWQPVILDLDDYDCATQASRLQAPGLSALDRYSLRRQRRRLEKIVPRLLNRCAHIWVASGEDQKLLGSFPTSILPNIPFETDGAQPVSPCPPRPESKGILMVGSLHHTVNVDAIERFLKMVWPQVHAETPAGELRIVGCGMTEDQKRRWGAVAGVTPVGFVEDLRPEYDRCAFAVAPVFAGGGTKIKVLESLRYGRTVVAATHACRGYEDVLRHGDALWIAPEERALVAGCTRLLREPGLRACLADRGCVLVREHYSYERFAQVVSEAVERVATGGKGVSARLPS
jgi:glycosyltransferase involved in cell wall biosynthesis